MGTQGTTEIATKGKHVMLKNPSLTSGRFGFRRSLLIGSALVCGHTLPAFAQPATEAELSETTDGNEIVVTARKRAERLSDIPESIAAVSNETLARNGVTTINDLGRQTPGLVLSRRQDNTANVVLRGIGSLGSVQGVGFYIDDVQNFTDTTARLEDLDHVEILKGPQGTLYGGSNIGGAIRYISKVPDFEEAGQVKVEMGERNYQNIYGALNVPIVDDKIAARVSGSFSHDDGYLPNLNLGGIPNGEMREVAVRGQLLLTPTENLTALFTTRYRRMSGAYGSYTRNSDINSPTYQSNTSFRPTATTTVWAGVANIKYEFGDTSLTSITSYTRQTQIKANDADYTSLAYRTSPGAQLAGFITDERPTEVMTQELRLSSENKSSLDWIFGLYGARIKNLNSVGVNGFLSINNGPKIFYLDRKIKQDDIAAFGTANLHLGDIIVGGGLRLLHTKFSYTPIVTNGVRQNPIVTQSVDYTALLPKLSLSYKVDPTTLIYASIAEGWESGKISVDADMPAPYKPEKAWTGEIGAKGRITQGLNYEVAAFYTRYIDRQIETRSYDSANNALGSERTDNIGTSISKGAEASIAWAPIDALSLTVAGGYLDATWKKGTYAYAERGTGIPRVIDLKGQAVPNSPKWNLNLGGTYTVPLTSSLEFEVHGDASYSDTFVWRLQPSGASNVNPSYWVTNARIALRNPNGKWELAARIENLFDERFYYEFAPQYFGVQRPDGTCNNCHLGSASAPRRFVASASIKF